NGNRPYVSTLEGALYTVREIEKASRLKVTGIINNSNLGFETSINDIYKGYELSIRLSEKLGIPLQFTTISNHLEKEADTFAKNYDVIFIQRYMKLPWEG
ncbi:MAG: hypothetical protein ACXVNF_07500, partial [Neobacillus sp.]